MLIPILAPIGEYRSQHVVPSRGKRAKKKAKKAKANAPAWSTHDGAPVLPSQAEALPDISRYVTVGFNSITRYLESLANKSASSRLNHKIEALTSPMSTPESGVKPFIPGPVANGLALDSEPLAAVFIPQSDHFSKLFAHIPVLVRTGNLPVVASSATRLVILPRAAEAKLSTALQIPRVGIIGLHIGAPMAFELIDTIRARIPPIAVPWIDQAVAGLYLPVNIEETTKAEAYQLKRTRSYEEADA